MDKVTKRRPGRPQKYGEPLNAREILVPRSVDEAATAAAESSGASVSEVYRQWIMLGRVIDARKKERRK